MYSLFLFSIFTGVGACNKCLSLNSPLYCIIKDFLDVEGKQLDTSNVLIGIGPCLKLYMLCVVFSPICKYNMS